MRLLTLTILAMALCGCATGLLHTSRGVSPHDHEHFDPQMLEVIYEDYNNQGGDNE